MRDIHFAQVLSRLAELRARSEPGDRSGLALAVASVLDPVGAYDGAARKRTVETLRGRIDWRGGA